MWKHLFYLLRTKHTQQLTLRERKYSSIQAKVRGKLKCWSADGCWAKVRLSWLLTAFHLSFGITQIFASNLIWLYKTRHSNSWEQLSGLQRRNIRRCDQINSVHYCAPLQKNPKHTPQMCLLQWAWPVYLETKTAVVGSCVLSAPWETQCYISAA